jgi:hypothetical protein
MVASKDTELLDELERVLLLVNQQHGIGPTSPIGFNRKIKVYYMKYAKAEPAAQLLTDILGGAGGGDLLGGMSSNLLGGGGLGGILGMALGGGGGGSQPSVLETVTGISVIPDARLNRLVIQGTPEEISLVDELLKVIDKEDSITDIRTDGSPHIIPVVYTSAEKVAKVVREAFPDEVSTGGSNGAGRGGSRQPDPAEIFRALQQRGGSRGGGRSQQAKSEPAKMTISVHEDSNSLIVVAPEKLYQKVATLVEDVDQAGTDLNDTVTVLPLGGTNIGAISQQLSSILGTQSSGSSTTTSPTSTSPSAQTVQARQQFIERLRASGFGGGSRGTSSRGTSSRGTSSRGSSRGGTSSRGGSRGR